MASPVALPVPADFAERSNGRSERQLSEIYGVGRNVIGRWRRESGWSARAFWSAHEDDYLRTHFQTSTIEAIAAHLNRTTGSIKGRASMLRLKTGRPVGWVRRELSTPINAGHSGEAAYLQAYGPIYRCYSDGKANPAGHHWYWAGQVLTHDEMEAKARAHRERKRLLAA